MFRFRDDSTYRRESARDILYSLPADFPGVLEARAALATGQRPAPILRLAWERFCQQRADELNQFATLSGELRQVRQRLNLQLNDSVMLELRRTKAELAEERELSETMKRRWSSLQKAIERERGISQQETSRLKAFILDQNRVIAHMQLRFEKLTGEKSIE